MRKEAAALCLISKMKYNTRSQPDCAFSLGGQPPCVGGYDTSRRRFFIGVSYRTLNRIDCQTLFWLNLSYRLIFDPPFAILIIEDHSSVSESRLHALRPVTGPSYRGVILFMHVPVGD